MYANYAQIKFIKIKRRSCFLNGARYGTLEYYNRLKTYDGYTDSVSDQRTLESLSRRRFCQHGRQPEVNGAVIDGERWRSLKSTTAVIQLSRS